MNLYSLKDNDLILYEAERKYTLKIRDLPLEEKPREKILRHGLEVLSAVELLAVVLSVGTKKEEVLSMASRIFKEYGENGLFNQKNPETMSKDLDIPLGKAMQIAACSELGRRFFQKKPNNSGTIRTPKDVFEYSKDMVNLPKEHLKGIYLNSRYRIIHDEVISIGTVDSSIIHPREVFKPAIECSAAAIVLVHNHPSGTTSPSQSDIEITEQLIKAGKLLGISLVDHVIVTDKKFASINVKYD